MSSSIKMIPWGAVLALTLAGGVGAQTGSAPASAQPPAAIGVSLQTADEANRKAVPRSDTGTVVRTAPSAADQTRSAVENSATTTTATGRSASGTLDNSGTSAATGSTSGSAGAPPPGEAGRSAGPAAREDSVQTALRRPRADRN